MSVNAVISNITRASLHDGPGVRTVVYFKGCGLACKWCHNPETLSSGQDILYAPVKCIHCGKCIEVCPSHHIIENGQMIFLREGCIGCGRCSDVCPSGALTASGKKMSFDEVMKEITKDLHYFQESGGGVTLSGGECLLQADFCSQILSACQSQNIHTAIETALFVRWKQIEKVLPFCDLIFADFKIPDPEKHEIYTGQNNKLILENLHRLVAAAAKKVILRIPLIPGVNDSPEDIQRFADALLPAADRLQSIEVLRYNTLARAKYTLFGKEYVDFGDAQTDQVLADYRQALAGALAHKTRVFTLTS